METAIGEFSTQFSLVLSGVLCYVLTGSLPKVFLLNTLARCCVLTLARKGNTLLYYLCFGFNRFSFGIYQSE
jgi:hypothetical protein